MGLYRTLNESFNKKLESLNEAEEIIEVSEVSDEEKDALRRALIHKYFTLQNKYETNIKAYEIAFQEAIEDLYPDKSWWEITGCNIFMDLFETRDPWITIDNIINQMIPQTEEDEEVIQELQRSDETLRESNKDNKDFDKQLEILKKRYIGYKTYFESMGEDEYDDWDIEDYDGQFCVITGLDLAINPTDPEGCFWNIKFEDGAEFYGISGYNLNLPDEVEDEETIKKLQKLYEAKIPDEDQHDSDIIRSIIKKKSARRNARLTPEEDAILKKYNIDYDSDAKDLTVNGATITPSMDNKTRYDWQKGKYTGNARSDKINYADRARKVSDRAATQVRSIDDTSWGKPNSRWTTNNRDLNAKVGGSRNLERARRDAVNRGFSKNRDEMEQALHARKLAKKGLDTIDADSDRQIADAKAKYDDRVASIERYRDYSKRHDQRSFDSNQEIINKLLKKDKDGALMEDFEHKPAKTIQELAEVWGKYDPDYLYYVSPKEEHAIIPMDNVIEDIDGKYVYVEGYAIQADPDFLCTVRIPISEFDKYYTLGVSD